MQNPVHRTRRSFAQRFGARLKALTSARGRGITTDRVWRNARLLVRHPRLFLAHVRAYLRAASEDLPYESWISAYDTITAGDIAALRAAVGANATKISILMPVYNTPERLLVRAIESIRGQAYQNWELCIADDASSAAHVPALLHRYSAEDARIKVRFRSGNGGISQASNAALELATGDYVAFVDHDDEIAPHALALVARAIAGDPDLDLIYSDEDKIDAAGKRFEPYFKPDWNPALSLAQNFVGHLAVFKRSLIERAGGFRSAFDGAQDFDLLLRCAELTTPDKIRHIPHVLYHWRAISGSTAESPSAKGYAASAACRAIGEALALRGIGASVEVTHQRYCQVHYPLTGTPPKVSILVPTSGSSDLVVRCLSKLHSLTTYPDFEVLLLVAEDAQRDARRRDIIASAARHERVRVLAYPDRPFNFSWVNNWGVAQARGSVLCFMNDDTLVITRDWLERLTARLALEGVGAVGPMLYYPDDRIQHAGVILGSGGVADHAHRMTPRYVPGYFGRAAVEQDVSCVTAACAVVSREAFAGVGGFDEKLAVAFNDVDFCIRLTQAGWRILWTPSVELYHVESASLGPHNSPERAALFQKEVQVMIERWGRMLASDKYYNPNLSLEQGRQFKLAAPPRADWRAALSPHATLPAI